MSNKHEINDICERLEKIEKIINDLKDNHLTHLQSSMDKVVTDMEWIKKTHFAVITSVIGTLMATLFNIISR